MKKATFTFAQSKLEGMKKVLHLILFFLICFQVNAQITFQKAYGNTDVEVGYCVKQTSDGGYILLGTTESYAAGLLDIYLIKINAGGDTLWTKAYGSALIETAYSLVVNNDGGYTFAGDGGSNSDVLIVRTDSIGNIIWLKLYGGTYLEHGFGIQKTSDAGYIVTGGSDNLSTSDNIFIFKTDSAGNLIWSKIAAGFLNEKGTSVIETSDGSYVVTGMTASFGVGSSDVILLKLSSSGNLLWTKTFGGSGTEIGCSVIESNDGTYVIGATTSSFGAGSFDVYIIKTDTSGNLLWSKTYGGSGSDGSNNEGNYIQQTQDGGYVLAGRTNSFGAGSYDVYLIKTDINGNLTWSRTFGDSDFDYGETVSQTSDGGYIILGRKLPGMGSGDFYLIKTDTTGKSGCREDTAATIVTSASTIVFNHNPNFYAYGTSTTYALNSNSGAIFSSLCLLTSAMGLAGDFESLVFPNPATNQLTIDNEKLKIKLVEIYDVVGEKVFQSHVSNFISTISLDVSQLPSGIYFAKITASEKEVRFAKFVKQ